MTTPVYDRPIRHPAAWKATDFKSKDDYAFDLGPRHVKALEDALAQVKARGLTLGQITRKDFPLDAIAEDLGLIAHEMHHGRGFLLLRGFPIERHSLADIEIMYWGFGSHFGRGVSQSVMGDLVGHVTDVTKEDPNARAYRNPKPLPLHTDYNEIIGMLSIRKAKTGGLSQYASALTIHNEILATKPHLLAPLYEGFHYHRRGEQLPGEGPVTAHKVPVFSNVDGFVSTRIIPGYMEAAAKEMGVSLPPLLVEGLAYYDELSRRPDIMLEVLLEPGELHIQNNFTLLHARSGFTDVDDAAQKRLLLRLWIEPDRPRPYDRNMQVFAGDSIAKQDGKKPSYAGNAFETGSQYRM